MLGRPIFALFFILGLGLLLAVHLGIQPATPDAVRFLYGYTLMGLFNFTLLSVIKRWYEARTSSARYALTNKCDLVLQGTSSNSALQAVAFEAIPDIHLSVGSRGIGAIRFGEPSFERSPLDDRTPTFRDIAEVAEVYALAEELRNLRLMAPEV